MFFRFYSSNVTPETPQGNIKFITMAEELANIEVYGESLGEQPSAEDYMFDSEDDVDMDAYCDPNVDMQKLGVSTDEHTYFGEVASRIGIDTFVQAKKAEISTAEVANTASAADSAE